MRRFALLLQNQAVYNELISHRIREQTLFSHIHSSTLFVHNGYEFLKLFPDEIKVFNLPFDNLSTMWTFDLNLHMSAYLINNFISAYSNLIKKQ